jgi:FkbM family methyltransferase
MILDAVRKSLPKEVKHKLRSIFSRLRHRRFNYLVVQHTRAVLGQRNIDLVLDVGANEGQFGLFLRNEVGYKGNIISFEPVRQTFEKLALVAEADKSWHTIHSAAGSEANKLVINIMKESIFSSFHKPKNGLFDDINRIVSSQEVNVVSLDSFLRDYDVQYSSIFLKTDTQGFDLEVIRGAEKIIPFVQGVQVELSFVPIYEKAIDYKQMLEELISRGFVISNMFPVSLTQLQAVEFDCIMVRKFPNAPGVHTSYERLVSETRRLKR